MRWVVARMLSFTTFWAAVKLDLLLNLRNVLVVHQPQVVTPAPDRQPLMLVEQALLLADKALVSEVVPDQVQQQVLWVVQPELPALLKYVNLRLRFRS